VLVSARQAEAELVEYPDRPDRSTEAERRHLRQRLAGTTGRGISGARHHNSSTSETNYTDTATLSSISEHDRSGVMADKWIVTSQRQDTILDENGPGFRTVWEVSYRVTSGAAQGVTGMVRVPVDQYNAQTVKDAIDAAVYHVDQVGGL